MTKTSTTRPNVCVSVKRLLLLLKILIKNRDLKILFFFKLQTNIINITSKITSRNKLYKKKQKKKSVSVQVITRSKPSALFKPAFVSLFRFDRSRFFVFSLSHIGSEILKDIVSSDSHPPSPLFFQPRANRDRKGSPFFPVPTLLC
jgi:hypothetical protein